MDHGLEGMLAFGKALEALREATIEREQREMRARARRQSMETLYQDLRPRLVARSQPDIRRHQSVWLRFTPGIHQEGARYLGPELPSGFAQDSIVRGRGVVAVVWLWPGDPVGRPPTFIEFCEAFGLDPTGDM